nr:hypothetical protein [Clostridium sp. 3-3]
MLENEWINYYKLNNYYLYNIQNTLAEILSGNKQFQFLHERSLEILLNYLKNYNFAYCNGIFKLESKAISPNKKTHKLSNKKVFLPEKISRSSTLNDYELLAFCYLKVLMPLTEMDQYHINIDSLLFAIYHDDKVGLKIRKKIYLAINSLLEKGYITGNISSRDSYILNFNSLNVDTTKEKYTVLEIDDMRKIMESQYKSKLQLFRYYIYLMDSINSKITVFLEGGKSKNNVVGHQTQEYLSSITGLSTRTIIRYNTMLEELCVIYVSRADDFTVNDKGEISQLPNVYGRYTDKDYIKKYSKDYSQYMSGHRQVQVKKQEANDNRKLAQKYHWLCKGHKYPDDEIIKIYNYILQSNKKYEALYDKEGYEDYLNKIKDLSVFDNYDFLERKE